jgi:hypothetical protein
MRAIVLVAGLSLAVLLGACSREETGTLQAASAALGANTLTSIEYSGTGRWFGQAPDPSLPWPAFTVTNFTASIRKQRIGHLVHRGRDGVLHEGWQPSQRRHRPAR